MFILFFGLFISYLLRKSLICIVIFIIVSRMPDALLMAR